MMKNLRLPQTSDSEVDLSLITPDYEGVVIGYKNNVAVGFVIYNDGEWSLQGNVNFADCIESDDNLAGLIASLLELKKCTNFKVIEFNK